MQNTSETPVTDLLDRVKQLAERRESVSFGMVLDQIQHQSFAPILLLIGLVLMVPGPADIPGVPVVLGLLVISVAAQIIIGRKHLWMPSSMEQKEVASDRVEKMVSWLRRPASWLDRVTKPRYQWAVNHAGVTVVALACIFIAMSTPALEFIPFSANVAGVAIAAFSLALIGKDGLIAGIAILFSVATAGIVAYHLMG